MKSSFKKLRDLTVSKHSLKDKASASFVDLEEEPQDVAQGLKDVEQMKVQYEQFLTHAHTIAGTCYDFSRALEEMASHMVEVFDQLIDVDTANVFTMLAKVHFEISKLLDIFGTHVSQAIIIPSEEMMSELQEVQTMKQKYDERRNVYHMAHKEMLKGKPKPGKMDNGITELEIERDGLKEQAEALCSRLQSLKHEQSRNLLTQVARYHSAQMHLFIKGFASISAVEPVMRHISSEKNINRNLPEVDLISQNMLESFPRVRDVSENKSENENSASSPESLNYDTDESEETANRSGRLNQSTNYINNDSSLMQEKSCMYVLPSPATVTGNQNHYTGEPPDASGIQSGQQLSGQFLVTRSNMKNKKVARHDEDSSSIPKIGRSFSHSEAVTPVSPRGKYGYAETFDHVPKSGPIYATSHTSFTSPQSGELHKLPPPPSPNSSHSVSSCKKAEVRRIKSDHAPHKTSKREFSKRSLSVPTSTKHLSEIQQESSSNVPKRENIMFHN